MDLLAETQGISDVNPYIQATWSQSSGYTTDAAGNRTPTYNTQPVYIQVQSLEGEELKNSGFYQVEGVYRSVYVYGDVVGLVRANSKGGDTLTFSQDPAQAPQVWKVMKVLETWRSWCKVAVCLQ